MQNIYLNNMLYVVNYANTRYHAQQQLNSQSAIEYGKADKVIEFHEEDIEWMKEEYPLHFANARGNGLWIWKPWICLKALEQIKEGDFLFYCDSGAIFINDLHLLLPDFEASGKDIMLYEQSLLSQEFTKSECYHLMNYHDYNGNQVLSGYILLRKSLTSLGYMKEWFENMQDIRKAHNSKYILNIPEFKNYISHREDQSVLDILRYKWGIKGYRDPSDFGIFPWQYAPAGTYAPKKFPNSHYPVILLCLRRNNPVEYKMKYLHNIKMYKCGLYNYPIVYMRCIFPKRLRHTGKVILTSLGLGKLNEYLKNKLMK